MRIVTFAGTTWLIAGLALAAPGQLRSPGGEPGFERTRIPVELQPHAIALGERVWSRGRERVGLQGQFTDEAGQRAARVTTQLPGLVRLEGMRADGTPILFDGDQARAEGAGLTARDQAVLDVFAVDSIEGLLGQVSHGAAVRLLGRGFVVDAAGRRPDGPAALDIFEITARLPTRGDHPVETRRYDFDSESGLLASVHRTVNGQAVETRFSYWGEVDGSMYPGLVERYEGGSRRFAFVTETVDTEPAGDAGIFRLP